MIRFHQSLWDFALYLSNCSFSLKKIFFKKRGVIKLFTLPFEYHYIKPTMRIDMRNILFKTNVPVFAFKIIYESSERMKQFE